MWRINALWRSFVVSYSVPPGFLRAQARRGGGEGALISRPFLTDLDALVTLILDVFTSGFGTEPGFKSPKTICGTA